MILADVGNRHIHIYEEGAVVDLSYDDAIEYFSSQTLYYICVNSAVDEKIKRYTSWKNISDLIHIDGEYSQMGVDRKALCLSRGDGIYIDAGSAITIDKVSGGRYTGGMIFPGLYSYKNAYSSISKKLDFDVELMDRELDDLGNLPKGTNKQIVYTILKPIVDSVNNIRGDLPLYITGGDRLVFGNLFDEVNLSNKFLFEGILKALKNS
jgi:type III pantothenate kinase